MPDIKHEHYPYTVAHQIINNALLPRVDGIVARSPVHVLPRSKGIDDHAHPFQARARHPITDVLSLRHPSNAVVGQFGGLLRYKPRAGGGVANLEYGGWASLYHTGGSRIQRVSARKTEEGEEGGSGGNTAKP